MNEQIEINGKEVSSPVYTKHGEHILAFQELGLWKGEIPVDLPPSGSPTLRWLGASVPFSVWYQLVAFFRAVNTKWESEAQARLAYNPDTHEWKALVLPQHVDTGMSSNEIRLTGLTEAQKVLRERAFKELEGGFLLNGTAHSHCNASAFASSTDAHDELTQPGLHITLGKLDNTDIHIHGRVIFRKVKYPVVWSDWFPSWPEDLDPRRDEFTLILGADYSDGYPAEWLNNCFEYVRPAPVSVGFHYTGRHSGPYYHNPWNDGSDGYPSEWEQNHASKPASLTGEVKSIPKDLWESGEWVDDDSMEELILSDLPDNQKAGVVDGLIRFLSDHIDNKEVAITTVKNLTDGDSDSSLADIQESCQQIIDAYDAVLDQMNSLFELGLQPETVNGLVNNALGVCSPIVPFPYGG